MRSTAVDITQLDPENRAYIAKCLDYARGVRAEDVPGVIILIPEVLSVGPEGANISTNTFVAGNHNVTVDMVVTLLSFLRRQNPFILRDAFQDYKTLFPAER